MQYLATSSGAWRRDFSAISLNQSRSTSSWTRLTWHLSLRNTKPLKSTKAEMKLRLEIGNLAAAFGNMAADLKEHQDKLLSYGRGLEAIISERAAELAQEKANLEMSVAERTAELNAANEILRS